MVNPECAAGKHGNCNGSSWDVALDAPVKCPCRCHGALALADRFDAEVGGVYGAVAARLRDDHVDVVQHVALAAAVLEQRMLDSFGGYEWGDPVRLWTIDGAEACLAPPPAPVEPLQRVRKVFRGECPRCGVEPPKTRKHALCADCRDVLAKSEWSEWAA